MLAQKVCRLQYETFLEGFLNDYLANFFCVSDICGFAFMRGLQWIWFMKADIQSFLCFSVTISMEKFN